jgi:hypothetical protein
MLIATSGAWSWTTRLAGALPPMFSSVGRRETPKTSWSTDTCRGVEAARRLPPCDWRFSIVALASVSCV